MISPCSCFGVNRRLFTWQLKVLRKCVPVDRVKATWSFMTQPQKSHFAISAVLCWSKHLQAPLPPQGYEIKVPCLNGKRVSKLVGCVLFLILVVDFN